MIDRKCGTCNEPIRKGSRDLYCSQLCRIRGARFEREYNKMGLFSDMLQTKTEIETVENMMDKREKESIAKARKLREAGQINEAKGNVNLVERRSDTP